MFGREIGSRELVKLYFPSKHAVVFKMYVELGDCRNLNLPTGGCESVSSEMLHILMRKHTHIHAHAHTHTDHFTVNAGCPAPPSELSLNQHSTQLLGDAPTPKPFTLSKELKPVLRKCMGKQLGKARDQSEVIQLRLLLSLDAPCNSSPTSLSFKASGFQNLMHLRRSETSVFSCSIQNTCWLRIYLCF